MENNWSIKQNNKSSLSILFTGKQTSNPLVVIAAHLNLVQWNSKLSLKRFNVMLREYIIFNHIFTNLSETSNVNWKTTKLFL